ncbi:MAG: hypothetical protein PHY29_08290 [Syntrophales bacterium]|nr:hypothetical protein [Syntrophales bacterium]
MKIMQQNRKSVKIIAMVPIISILLIGLLMCLNVSAEEEKPTGSADVAILSKYVWRGEEFSKDSVIVQPSATIAYKGVSLNLWGSLDTDVYNGAYEDTAKWNETDLTIGYDKSFGPVSLGAGYIYYALDSITDSQEFYFSIGVDTIASPTLTVYREVTGALAGWYASLGVSHSFDLPNEMTLDLAASAGYYYSDNDFYVEYLDDLTATTEPLRGLKDGVISVGLTIPVDDYISISPTLSYSVALSDKADNFITANSKSNDSDFFYGGVTLSMSF